MARIQILQNGIRTDATKADVLSLAQRGLLTPESPIWIDGTQTTCGRIREIVFGVAVPAAPPLPPVCAPQLNTDEPCNTVAATSKNNIQQSHSIISSAAKYGCIGCASVVAFFFVIIIISVFMSAAIDQSDTSSGGFSSTGSEEREQRRIERQKAKEEARKVTMANFLQVSNGMSEREVIGILGSNYEVSAESEIDTGFGPSVRIRMLSWSTEKGLGNCNVTFENDKVTVKAQFGLK